MILNKKENDAIKKVGKNKGLFLSLFDRILKLKCLRLFELSVGFVKGFAVKVEFFEDK